MLGPTAHPLLQPPVLLRVSLSDNNTELPPPTHSATPLTLLHFHVKSAYLCRALNQRRRRGSAGLSTAGVETLRGETWPGHVTRSLAAGMT